MANSNPSTPNHAAPVFDADDMRVKSLLDSVPVPENLKERTKSRLRTALLVDPCVESPHENSSTLDGNASSLETRSIEEESLAIAKKSGLRETMRRAVILLTLAAGLAGLAFLANRWRQPNERDWLVKQCQSILSNWDQDNPANLETESSLAELPAAVREQLARITLRGTRSLEALGSKFKGTLYRVDAANGQSLVLMRLADLPAVRGLSSRFSVLPTPSGGWSLVALQVNSETYVLAAQCTEQELISYIRQPVVT